MPNFFPLWWLNVRTKRQAATYFGDSTNYYFFFFSSSTSFLKWLSVIIIFYSFFLIPHTQNLLSLLSSSSSSSCCLMLSSCFLTFLKRLMYNFFFSLGVLCIKWGREWDSKWLDNKVLMCYGSLMYLWCTYYPHFFLYFILSSWLLRGSNGSMIYRGSHITRCCHSSFIFGLDRNCLFEQIDQNQPKSIIIIHVNSLIQCDSKLVV